MTPIENKAIHVAEDLHGKVKFGKSSTMIEQLRRTRELLAENTELTGEERDILLAAAWLNKCHEPKRIDTENGKTPWTIKDIENHFGSKVSQVVGELMTEPDEPEHLTKMQQWAIKADWAQTLSVASQQILLAEKIINYMQTRDDPTPKWSVARHKEYLDSRDLMVEAIKDASPRLYQLSRKVKGEALVSLEKLAQKQAQDQAISSQKPLQQSTANGRDGR